MTENRQEQSPEDVLREVVKLCGSCGVCHSMMGTDCAFFIKLFQLRVLERNESIPASDAQLRDLADLCTLCSLCPCPKIPIKVMEAKSLYVEQSGMPFASRLISDVPRLARLCSTFSRLIEVLQSNHTLDSLLRKATRIHPDRELPSFPKKNFFHWAADKGLDQKSKDKPHVTYFAGCAAGYLFPEVGRSVVEILQHNGATVYVPPQQCCGMPLLVEGDRDRTLQLASANMQRLLESARAGDDIVYSCPTCGFFLKSLLRERAYYSDSYQKSVDAADDVFKVPAPGYEERVFWHLNKSMYQKILKDDGYFSSIDPLDRVELSDHLSDFGAYLIRLHRQGRLATDFAPRPERMAYFAPCHLREQKIGRPYLELLKLIPNLVIEPVGGEFDCCGMGGVFGFKEHFHQKSLYLATPLMEKMRAANPRVIVTDCMSCRLQFNHCLPYPVFHPVEVLARAYQERKYESGGSCEYH